MSSGFEPRPEIRPLYKRYADAYYVANFQDGFGRAIKIGSLVLGGLVVSVSLLLTFASSLPQQGFFGSSPNFAGIGLGVIGALVGVLIGGLGFVFGVLVSSQGQLLKATLDAAINSSPFLSDAERARMMTI